MMTRKPGVAMLLATAALVPASPALAAGQEQAPAQAGQSGDLQAQIDRLQAQVEALQKALESVKASQVQATPSWKGGPELADKASGFTFKPRGRIMYDVGHVSNPGDSLATRNLGFNTRARRIRLGAEGTIPGGFGYKFEMDFANASVGFGDAIITYAPSGKPYSVTIGNHETMDGLEQISSSRFISHLERGAFNDAFNNTRRIGVSVGYAGKGGDVRVNGGLFAAHSIDSSFDNDGWIGAARAVYSPKVGSSQLHFGANVQHREFQSNNGATASSSQGSPSTNQLARYRARPFSQTTDVRFVDTGSFAAKGDDIFGVELAGIFRSLHLTAEGQYLKTRAYGAGDTFSGDPLDYFASSSGTPALSAFVPDGDPAFWGGYVEAGYFLTGETRGYKNGAWDRTKVLKPFSKGGWGAVQVNARLDYLDLDSRRLKSGCTNNFVTGACTATAALGRGGTQLGYLGSLVWLPEDWFRFYLQYARAQVTGGPFAATVRPGSSKPVDERSYGVDVVAARASIDF